jgi:hypothetical protein
LCTYVSFCKLCILIVMYALFCIFCFYRANWHSSATLTEVFPCFFLNVRQVPGYIHKDEARPALFLISELCSSMYCFVSIVLFYVLFVCKYVLLPPDDNPIAVEKQSSPVTGLEWPRRFQRVKVPRFHVNGTGWW